MAELRDHLIATCVDRDSATIVSQNHREVASKTIVDPRAVLRSSIATVVSPEETKNREKIVKKREKVSHCSVNNLVTSAAVSNASALSNPDLPSDMQLMARIKSEMIFDEGPKMLLDEGNNSCPPRKHTPLLP